MSRRLRALLVAVLVAATGGCTGVDGGGYEVVAEFDRTFNLFEGSDVRVLGVDAGKVADIAYPAGTRAVQVTLRLDAGTRIAADSTAAIIPDALLGERFVALEPPAPGQEALDAGATIPLERTRVPAELDEVLESLNDALDDLPPDEVARLLGNLAEVLDGRGATLGRTIDQVAVAVDTLRANDDAVIALASRLADLNGTLATRRAALGTIIDDWDTVVGTLADERDALDGALTGVARLSAEVVDLLEGRGGTLAADIRTATRLGRTAQRNLSEIDLLLYGQSELYRHAQRVFDFEKNWLPLVNHSEDLNRVVADRLEARLTDVCQRLQIPRCSIEGFWAQQLPAEVCFAPVALCPGHPARPDGDVVDPDPPATLREALEDAVEAVPELPERLGDLRRSESDGGASAGPLTGVVP